MNCKCILRPAHTISFHENHPKNPLMGINLRPMLKGSAPILASYPEVKTTFIPASLANVYTFS